VDGYYLQWVQKGQGYSNTITIIAGLMVGPPGSAGRDLEQMHLTYGVNVKASPFSISEYVQVPAGTTRADILDIISI
jgi:hypothetical protein